MSGTALQRRLRRNNNDEESRAIIYDGASVNQLAAMFGVSNTEAARRLRHLAPVGIRSGYPIYAVKEAAEHFVKPRVNVDEYVRKMGVRDLPPSLQKDLWAAMNGQLKFEEAQGKVWRTERVVETWSAWHKQVRMTLLLAVDEAERETGMTPDLHTWFKGYIDRLLLTLSRDLSAVLSSLPTQTSGIIEYDADEQPDDDTPAVAADEDDEPL